MDTCNNKTYVTSDKMLSDVNQIEFLLHAFKVWLRGLLDLINLSSSSLTLVLVARAAVKDIWLEQLSHPPYSPDLAPTGL